MQWTAGLARLAPRGQTNPVWPSCVLSYDITRRPWRRLFHGLGVYRLIVGALCFCKAHRLRMSGMPRAQLIARLAQP